MKLTELMKSKGYSFQDLADASGVAKATIARLIYGQAKEPHPSTKRKIAGVFNLEISDIDELNPGAISKETSPLPVAPSIGSDEDNDDQII